MQIIRDEMIMNNQILDFGMTENQKIESICQQLKHICTVSLKLLPPKSRQKPIRKKRVLKKWFKIHTSKKESKRVQSKKTIPNYFEVSRNEMEEKIALISGLQQQIQQLKLMMPQI
ncbi:unnamed protein product [Paramecium octaurelia]|uniref:Uncharacterized protein n=1 Tax=Paramecium octaurelia TaxID=43137 RepID=A0A8S1W576_PAROT|nr:unnamed protein product [Paramecium octaurelia]